MLEFLVYAFKALAVLALGFAPGYLLATLFTKKKDWELALLSVALSMLFCASSEFLAYLLNADAFLFNFSATVLAIAALLALAFMREEKFRPLPRLALAFAAFFLAVVCVQALIPVYAGAYWYGDWWMHYDIALAYLDHAPLDKTWFPEHYTLTSRTPLFNLSGAYFMSLLGKEFWGFQIAATLLNTAFIIPLALLAKKLGFGKNSSAVLAISLAILNASLLSNAYYTWSKLIISFFLLAAIYYYLELRKQMQEGKLEAGTGALFGFFSGAAFMSHQTALYYLLPLALDYAILSALNYRKEGKLFKAGWKPLLLAAAVALAVLAPWHAWAFYNFGVTETISSTPALKAGFTSQGFLQDRLKNAVATLYPVFQQEWYGNWFTNTSPLVLLDCKDIGCYGAFYSVTLRFWLDVLPGALTVSGSIALIAIAIGGILSGTIRKIVSPREPEFVFLLMLPISFALGCLTTMYVDEKGWMPLFLPTLLILQILIARSLAGWNPRLRTLALAAIILEFVVIKGSHVYLLFTEQMTAFEPFNMPLKTDNGLAFAFDYLGGGRIIAALFAVALYAAFIACALWLSSREDMEEKAGSVIG